MATSKLEIIPKISHREYSILGLTKSGEPKHPLYLRADLDPVRWEVDAKELAARLLSGKWNNQQDN